MKKENKKRKRSSTEEEAKRKAHTNGQQHAADDSAESKKSKKKKKTKKQKKAAATQEVTAEKTVATEPAAGAEKKKKKKKEKKNKKRPSAEESNGESTKQNGEEKKPKNKKQKTNQAGETHSESTLNGHNSQNAAAEELSESEVKAFHETNMITVSGEGDFTFNPIISFARAQQIFSQKVREEVDPSQHKFAELAFATTKNFAKPTPIQSQCWPILLAKRYVSDATFPRHSSYLEDRYSNRFYSPL